MKYMGAWTLLQSSWTSPPCAPSIWQDGWKITPHLTSVESTDVWKQAQPPQQQPTTPTVDAPSALACARSASTLGLVASHVTVLIQGMKSSPRFARSNVGGRPSPSVPPSNAGWRS